MAAKKYTDTILRKPVRFAGDLAIVHLAPEVEARFHRAHLLEIARRWPNGTLILHPASRPGAKPQVRLRWDGCKGRREPVTRIVLTLMGHGDMAHQQAQHRFRDPLDLTPENLSLSERGPLAGSDATFQETARRGWITDHRDRLAGGEK